MTTQLEIAKSKLNRLREEEKELMKAIRKERDSIPFGQPNIIGRRDIYKDVKRYRAKSIANVYEQDKQEKRIEMFSSPFIEERLYFMEFTENTVVRNSGFSSPFIEERLYFNPVTV